VLENDAQLFVDGIAKFVDDGRLFPWAERKLKIDVLRSGLVVVVRWTKKERLRKLDRLRWVGMQTLAELFHFC